MSRPIDEASMISFVIQGLSQLLSKASRSHKALKAEADRVLKLLQKEQKVTAAAKGHDRPVDSDADKYFLPFKLACETDSADVRKLALDYIQKLIAYGYLNGTSVADAKVYPVPTKVDPTGREQKAAGAAMAIGATAAAAGAAANRRLIDVIIETVYECSMFEDDHVQLQVIKALLTAVSSVNCQVHDQTLLRAVRGCYHIYLMSRNVVNQTTAKATLTQMLNIVFQRMENYNFQLTQLQIEDDEAAREHAQAALAALTKATAAAAAAAATGAAPPPHANGTANGATPATADSTVSAVVTDLVNAVAGTTPAASAAANAALAAAANAALPKGKYGVCVMCKRPANHYCLESTDPVCGMDCKLLNLKRREQLKAGGAAAVAPASPTTAAAIMDAERKQALIQLGATLNTLRQDSFLLFRALCKLSTKALPEPPEALALRSKTLSLELLLSVLDNSGPLFRSSAQFVGLVREDLVQSVLSNLVSPIDTIFPLSSSICVTLTNHFKAHLKREIGAIQIVLLQILDSPNSTYSHKMMSLRVLAKLCGDPQTVVDLFLNYDCDVNMDFNLFKQISEQLEKITRSRYVSENWMDEKQDSQLRLAALECYAAIMRSLAIWTKKVDGHANAIIDEADTDSERRAARAAAAAAETSRNSNGAGEEPSTTTAPGSASKTAAATTRAGNATPTAGSARHTKRDSRDISRSGAAVASAIAAAAPAAEDEKTADAKDGGAGADGADASDTVSVSGAAAGATAASGTAAASADPSKPSFSSQFQEQRRQKIRWETGVKKFNDNQKKGLAWLFEQGMVKNTPEGVAEFLHAQIRGLDKVMVGDYLGRETEFNRKSMHCYIEAIDFTGQSFDEAIRHFVSHFRLPGEAQVIDRLLEKFAQQYCEKNPSVFASADTAYVLAFSIIMLNTDAHNPQVKKKMTKEGFLKNNRGIDNGKDLDKTYLCDVYDRVVNNEIKMKDDFSVRGQDKSSALNPKNRINVFLKEGAAMLATTNDLIKKRHKPVVRPPKNWVDKMATKKDKDKDKKSKGDSTADTASGKPSDSTATAAAGTSPASESGSASTASDASSSNGSTPASSTSGNAATGSPPPATPESLPASTSSAGAKSNGQHTSGSTPSAIAVPIAAAAAAAAATMLASAPATPAASATATSSAVAPDNNAFYTATPDDIDAVQEMFDIVWMGALATFGTLLEEGTQPRLVALCLDGYRHAVRVCCAFNLDIQRLAFVGSIAKFTLLGTTKEMKQKNIDAINTLIMIAHTEGNYLKGAWHDILKCISEYERLQLIGSGSRPTVDVFQAASPARGAAGSGTNASGDRVSDRERFSGGGGAGGNNGGEPTTKQQTEQLNSLSVIKKVESSSIDKIFTHSAQLDGEAIIDFVENLRRVSEAELMHPETPRVYSLQKIVEITYHNMGRIRLVWTRIWTILSEFFNSAGCHPNHKVSMYAVDSLRQLANKFLEKDELSNFQFQKMFLKPFEYIMANTPTVDVKEFIVESLSRMVRARVNNVKSGWKSVFVVLTYAGKHNTAPPLVKAAFALVTTIHRDMWNHIAAADAGAGQRHGTETIDECVNCLVAFGCCAFPDISLQAIEYLTRCATYLAKLPADGSAPSPSSGADVKSLVRASSHDSTPAPAGGPIAEHSAAAVAAAAAADAPNSHLRVWFLLLTGLAKLIGDGRLQVRSRALQALFTTLLAHGHLFSLGEWRMIFRGVLAPIFDDVRHVVVTRRPPQSIAGGATNALDPSAPPVPPRTPGRAPKPNTTAAAAAGAGPGAGPATPNRPPPPPNAGTAPSGAGAGRKTISAFTADEEEDPYAAFEDDWLSTTCLAALSTLVELFVRFHKTIHSLLPDLLALIDSCIDQPSEDLARIGIKCWSLLIRSVAGQLAPDHWTIVTVTLSSILRRTLPTQLVGAQLRQYLRLDTPNAPAPATTPAAARTSPALAATTPAAKPDSIAIAPAATPKTPKAAASAAGDAAAAPNSADAALSTDSAATTAPAASNDGKTAPAAAPAPVPAPIATTAPAPTPAANSILQTSATWNAELAVTRCRVHLILMDAAYEVLLSLFPRFTTVKRARAASNADVDTKSESVASAAATALNTYRVRRSAFRSTYALYRASLQRPRSESKATRDAVEAERDAKEQQHRLNAANALAAASAAANSSFPLASSAHRPSVTSGATPAAGSSGLDQIDTKSPVTLDAAHLCTLLSALSESAAFARSFNSDKELRRRLHAAGLMRKSDRTLPELYFQESRAWKISTHILLKMYTDEQPTAQAADDADAESNAAAAANADGDDTSDVELSDAEHRLMSLTTHVLREYIGRAKRSDPEETDGLNHLSSVVATALDGFVRFHPRQFATHLSSFYPLWMDLVAVGSVEIRSVLRKLLLSRVGKILAL